MVSVKCLGDGKRAPIQNVIYLIILRLLLIRQFLGIINTCLMDKPLEDPTTKQLFLCNEQTNVRCPPGWYRNMLGVEGAGYCCLATGRNFTNSDYNTIVDCTIAICYGQSKRWIWSQSLINFPVLFVIQTLISAYKWTIAKIIQTSVLFLGPIDCDIICDQKRVPCWRVFTAHTLLPSPYFLFIKKSQYTPSPTLPPRFQCHPSL